MTTMTTRKFRRTLESGTRVEVLSEKELTLRNGMLAGDRVVRTWVRNVATHEELDLRAGCAFEWAGAVRRAGW